MRRTYAALGLWCGLLALAAPHVLAAPQAAPGPNGNDGYPRHFSFDGAPRTDRGLTFEFARNSPAANSDGSLVPSNTPRFQPSRLLCGAPEVTTLPGTTDLGNIPILATGLAADGLTPVWVIYNATHGQLSIHLGEVSGDGFFYNNAPNPAKSNLTDFLRDSIDSSPDEAWILRSVIVCHGMAVAQCNVAMRHAGGFMVANRTGFATCRLADLSGPKNLWWRRHAYSDPLAAPNTFIITMGATWSMPTWWALDRSADPARPTKVWIAAADYRLAPCKDGGVYCVFPLTRASEDSDLWSAGPVVELPGRFFIENHITHAHAVGLARYGQSGIVALGARGDSLFNNVDYLWTIDDENDYAAGASPNPAGFNWFSGASAWTGPGEVHGEITAAAADVSTRRYGNQFVGLAPGPTPGTLLVGADEVSQGLMSTPDLSAGAATVEFSSIYPGVPTNWLPAPGTTATPNRYLSFHIKKADPTTLGGSYVAHLGPGQQAPERSMGDRVMFSPDGVNFGQCWAHRENEQTLPFIVGDDIWIGSLGLGLGLGVRHTPVPDWRLFRPLSVSRGGPNLLQSPCPLTQVSDGVLVEAVELPAGLPAPPCMGPVYRITIAPASTGAASSTFRLTPALPQAGNVRLRLHVLTEPGASRPGSTAFQAILQTVDDAAGPQSRKSSAPSAVISLPARAPWAPIVLASDVSTWGAQSGPAALELVLCSADGARVPGSYLVAFDSLAVADAPPYAGPPGSTLPAEAAALSGFSLDSDWSVLLAAMVPMDSWDKISSVPSPASRPLVALAGSDNAWWIEVSADAGANAISARFFDGAAYSQPAQVGGLYWSAGSPILLGLAFDSAARTLTLRASVGGSQPVGAVLDSVVPTSPFSIVRFSDGAGQSVTPLDWFGGLIDDTARSWESLDASLRSLDFVLQQIPCPTDLNQDGFTDGIDYDEFMNAFEAGDPFADYNRDSFVDGIDYDTFVNAFEAGC